jgi:hypothetical protein
LLPLLRAYMFMTGPQLNHIIIIVIFRDEKHLGFIRNRWYSCNNILKFWLRSNSYEAIIFRVLQFKTRRRYSHSPVLLCLSVGVRCWVGDAVVVDKFHAFGLVTVHGHGIFAYLSLFRCIIQTSLLYGLSLGKLIEE